MNRSFAAIYSSISSLISIINILLNDDPVYGHILLSLIMSVFEIIIS